MATVTGPTTPSTIVGAAVAGVAASALGSEAVRAALAGGATTSIDRTNGRKTELYAACPTDGQPSSVRRFTRGERGSITAVTMRCSRCGGEFVPPVEALYLR
jgi:hypothetical protein